MVSLTPWGQPSSVEAAGADPVVRRIAPPIEVWNTIF